MNTGISDYLKFSGLRMGINVLKIYRKTALVVSLSYTSRTNAVEIYRNPEAGGRCLCGILDLSISRLPSEAKDKDLFDVRPMEKPSSSTPTYERSVRYYSIPVWRIKLA